MQGNYKVITLCGSTRFKKEYLEAQKRLTLEGNIVISVGLFGHAGDSEVWEGMEDGTRTKTKEMLDDMHKRKIDMADEIFVINVGGYIGESTRSEIEYARAQGKTVRWLEDRDLSAQEKTAEKADQKEVCVFGASSSQIPENMVKRVRELARKLGREHFSLVFGGFSNGLMKAAADGFADADAAVTGVIPDSLAANRTVHPACTRVIRTHSLAERKQKMIEIADAFVALPGGIGTLDEIFSVLAMENIGETKKPLILYGPEGFYEPLVRWMDQLYDGKYNHRPVSELLFVSDDADEIAEYLKKRL